MSNLAGRFVRSASAGTAHVVACLSPLVAAREEVAWELLQSERVFYRSIIIISECFSTLAKPRSQLAKIFVEVDALLRLHADSLMILMNKMDNWSETSVLGPLLVRVAKKSNVEIYTRFHRMVADLAKEANKFLPGGKHFQRHEEMAAKGARIRKTDTA